MRAFNLKSTVLTLPFGELEAIGLGEKGRGRNYTLIPCPVGIDKENNIEIGISKTGKPKIVRSSTPTTGWVARINTEGCYTRGTSGRAYKVKDDPVEVIAIGNGAYGDAGRIGEWKDYVLKIPCNTAIRVLPSGGRSKVPSYYLYFGETKVTRMDKEEFYLFVDQNNLAIDQEDWEEL